MSATSSWEGKYTNFMFGERQSIETEWNKKQLISNLNASNALRLTCQNYSIRQKLLEKENCLVCETHKNKRDHGQELPFWKLFQFGII